MLFIYFVYFQSEIQIYAQYVELNKFVIYYLMLCYERSFEEGICLSVKQEGMCNDEEMVRESSYLGHRVGAGGGYEIAVSAWTWFCRVN